MRSGTTLAANFLNSISGFTVLRDFLHIERLRKAAQCEHIKESLSEAQKQRAMRKHNQMTKKIPYKENKFMLESWRFQSIHSFYNHFLTLLEEQGGRVVGHKTTNAHNVLSQVLSATSDLKAIYVVRDPRDVVVSASSKWPHEKRGQLENVCSNWNDGLEEALMLKNRFESRLYILRFEDLVIHTGMEINHLARFIGTEVERPKELKEYGRPWGGNSSFENGSALFDTTAVGRWETRRPWIKKQVEESCGHLMNKVGYDMNIQPGANAYIKAVPQRVIALTQEYKAYTKSRAMRFLSKVRSMVTT